MGFMVIVAQAQPGPDGDFGQALRDAGESAAGLWNSAGSLFSAWASSDYGWVLGLAALYLFYLIVIRPIMRRG